MSAPVVKPRNESLDVLKGITILLVVFGHLLEHLADITHSPLYNSILSAVLLINVPLFVLTSGMLAKSALSEADYYKMFARLLLPLFCLQVVYLGIVKLLGGDVVQLLLDPVWTLWFLLSICFWRMLLPLFLHIPVPLLVAVAIALAAGYSLRIGGDLSVSRTVYFFPIFLIGYLLRERLPALVSRLKVVWLLVFVLVMTGIVFWYLHGLNRDVFFGAKGYDQVTAWAEFPALGRLAMLTMSTVASVAFMAIMPGRSAWLTRLGRRTLTIFALHGFVVLLCYKLINLIGLTAWPVVLPALVVLTVAITWALSWLDGPFNRFFDRLAALLSRRDQGAHRAGKAADAHRGPNKTPE